MSTPTVYKIATISFQDDDSDSNDSAAPCPVGDREVKEHGFTTVNSGVSVADYFAKKMAALKQAKVGSVSDGNIQVQQEVCALSWLSK